jgi:hypothetical protein
MLFMRKAVGRPEHFAGELPQAILYTLMYSDVFDFPLTAHEIHRYLSGTSATYEEVLNALDTDPRISKTENYYSLIGREEIIRIRRERESRSQKLLPIALKYGRMIGVLPFVRMVALTGSLAVMNVSRDFDFDYMLVTQPGRLWTARAFVLLLNRFTRLFGHTICPNLIVSSNCLEWRHHDLYSAREFCQMIPVSGMETYNRLMKSNDWIREYLPNAFTESSGSPQNKQPTAVSQRIFERLLSGKPGDLFENWEMRRKIGRFAKQAGFGEETIFDADICQGNFDHHRKWTEAELQRRVDRFDTETASLSKQEIVVSNA